MGLGSCVILDVIYRDNCEANPSTRDTLQIFFVTCEV
jgi:hypothetical protein